MAITHRILYVDKCSTILANSAAGVAARATLTAWCTAKLITAIKWYCAGQSTANMAILRTYMEYLRDNTTVQGHQYVMSGGLNSYSTSLIGGAGNLLQTPHIVSGAQIGMGARQPIVSDILGALNADQRFFPSGIDQHGGDETGNGSDLEREFYNAGSPNSTPALQVADYLNNWLPFVEQCMIGLDYSDLDQYQSQAPAGSYNRRGCDVTAYLGWWSNVWQAPLAVVRMLTRLDLHTYTPSTNAGGSTRAARLAALFPYMRARLEDIAFAQSSYANSPVQTSIGSTGIIPANPMWANSASSFKVLPIFSFEAANWAGTWINSTTGATVTSATNPATGGTGNGSGWSKVYNHLTNSLQSATDGGNYSGMLAYSGTLAGGGSNPTAITGSNTTFDIIFNNYLAGKDAPIAGDPTDYTGTTNFRSWKALNVMGNSAYITEPDGYVIFAYSHAFAARPSTSTP